MLSLRHDDIAILPDWIFNRAGAPEAANIEAGEQSPVPAPERPQRLANARETATGAAALVGECQRVAQAPPGARNEALNRAAFSVGTAVGAGWIDEADAREGLRQAALNSEARDTPRQIEATLNSGLRRGIARPRNPLPIGEGQGGNVVPIRPLLPEDEDGTAGVTWDDAAAPNATVEWLVKHIIPRCGVGLMPGQSTAGKSFCALDLAGAVATGTPFFGFRSRMRGGTLFLLGEAEATMRPRLKALRDGKLASVPAADPETGEVLFDVDRLPIAWRGVLQLCLPSQLAAAETLVRNVSEEMMARHGVPLRLIIVDTALAAFGFPEDPDAASTQAAINGLKRLAEACDGFALALHHHGKSVEAGAAGSFMWKGAVDVELAVTAKKGTGGVVARRIAMEKNRFGPAEWSSGFDLATVEVGSDEDGEPVTSCYVLPEADATGQTASVRSSGTLSKAGRVVLECIEGSLATHGFQQPLGMNGALVQAVALDEVKALFRVRYAPGGPPERQADAIRKAFSRGLDAVRLTGRAMVREIDGIESAWLTDGFGTTRERLDRMEPPFSRTLN